MKNNTLYKENLTFSKSDGRKEQKNKRTKEQKNKRFSIPNLATSSTTGKTFSSKGFLTEEAHILLFYAFTRLSCVDMQQLEPHALWGAVGDRG